MSKKTLDTHRVEAKAEVTLTERHNCTMWRLATLSALCVGIALLQAAAGDVYQLPAFDTVSVETLLNNEVTVLIAPSVVGSYSLNASVPGLVYTADPDRGTLELSQQALALDPLFGLVDQVFGEPGIYDLQQPAGEPSWQALLVLRQASCSACASKAFRSWQVLGARQWMSCYVLLFTYTYSDERSNACRI